MIFAWGVFILYFSLVFYKTITPLALVGYKTNTSQLSATGLGYLSSHIQHALVESLLSMVVYHERTLDDAYIKISGVFCPAPGSITILCQAIENTVANSITTTYARRMMGRLDGIPSNKERLSCICIF